MRSISLALALVITSLVPITSCSVSGTAREPDVEVADDVDRPQCFNQCANEFSICTGESHPGDYSACSAQRQRCETSCRERNETLRAEEQGNTLIEPTPEEVEKFRGDSEAATPEETADEQGDAAGEAAGEVRRSIDREPAEGGAADEREPESISPPTDPDATTEDPPEESVGESTGETSE
jgi:hypothetical protein